MRKELQGYTQNDLICKTEYCHQHIKCITTKQKRKSYTVTKQSHRWIITVTYSDYKIHPKLAHAKFIHIYQIFPSYGL